MSVLTKARSAIARSGATRSGYPVAQGKVLPTYALAGVARAGATRSNYHSPQLFISIGGVQYATARSVASQRVLALTISGVLAETPDTAQLTTEGFTPRVGQDVIITLGSMNNLDREFAGQVLNATQRYVGTPANFQHAVNAIDYTWGLNKRKVSAKFTSTTVGTIATTLVATYAPGYTLRLSSDITSVAIDEISFTNQDLTACLTQLTKRVGGHWKCNPLKVVRLFIVDTESTNPTIINSVNALLLGETFQATSDLSQVLTRVYVEGGGANALQQLAAGETIIPVETAVWYQPTGVVVSGPQRISYTSVDQGGAGSLVGPGAAPVAAPAAALASGAGITDGSHDYAVTFVTATGESLPSPHVSVTVGVVAPPAAAPMAGTPTIGTGPDPGSHDYAVSFVTTSGETTPGPHVTRATGLTAAPASAPTVGAATAGGSVDAGDHDYAVTFVTSIGETTPSPISTQVTTLTVAAPTATPVATESDFIETNEGLAAPGDVVYYVCTYTNAAGETVVGPASNTITRAVYTGTTPPAIGLPKGIIITVPALGTGATSGKIYRNTNGAWSVYGTFNGAGSFFDNGLNWVGSASPPGSNTATVKTVPLSNIPLGDANVTSRKLYRRSGGVGLRFLTTIGNNTATTYTDTTANASLGAAAPSTSTAYLQRIPLTNIPKGGALVTARKVWGTAAGASQLKLITTINDNVTTSYTVTTTDAGLGANAPTSNTATANQVALSSIPIGATTVTQRKVYRTAAGVSQLQLLTTLADNVTTTFTDAVADASLGANVPAADTSGLPQPAGVVLAGSTSLIVAGPAAFSASGGWAVIGNGQQVIRYTGIAGSVLTGVPSIGVGAIAATIAYNSTVTAAPSLRGVPASGTGAILYTIQQGAAVNLLAQVDDVAAQTALAALIGGDGIQDDVLDDQRISYTEAVARGQAWLTLRKDVEVSIRCQSRDLNMRAGRSAAVNLGAFNLVAAFTIQQVTLSNFQPALFPTRDASASSVRFTFEDYLRLVKAA
jgi:hypothetical protein